MLLSAVRRPAATGLQWRPVEPHVAEPTWQTPAHHAAAWLGARTLGTVAVLAYGCVAAGEDVPGARLEVLHVGRQALDPGQLDRVQRELARRLEGQRLTLASIAAHRLGWLPP